jgi:hypothetical protein
MTALRSRMRAAARRACERQTAAPTQRAGDDLTLRELQQLLDEEIAALPAKYQAPVILCCLEGKTRDEAAAELGWSAGSLKGRLERGRELLRERLARRGLSLSVGFAALTLTPGATVSAGLAASTTLAGTAFATGSIPAGLVSAEAVGLAQAVLREAVFPDQGGVGPAAAGGGRIRAGVLRRARAGGAAPACRDCRARTDGLSRSSRRGRSPPCRGAAHRGRQRRRTGTQAAPAEAGAAEESRAQPGVRYLGLWAEGERHAEDHRERRQAPRREDDAAAGPARFL